MEERMIRTFLVWGIRVYQDVSRWYLPTACRFWPSCSEYAAEALREHGVFPGIWLSVRRLARCHPFTEGGVDLVPRGVR